MIERRPLPYDWSDLRAKLQDALPTVLGRLNLRCDKSGQPLGRDGIMYPRNPTRSDRHPGSFVVWTEGNAKGAWKDYATAGPDQGDVFDLIAYVGGLRSKMDAYWWAVDCLGLPRQGHTNNVRTLTDAEQERARRERDRQAAEAKQIEDDEAKSAALFTLWLSLKPIAGTPAETYLRHARGIELERLARSPDALRWADRVEYDNQTTGEVIEWRNVMVSAMTRGKKVVALHRTYLKPDGSGKADLDKAKLMIGPVRGSAIRLARGPSGLSPTEAAKQGKRGPLAIGEGIETCLTLACARPDYRVWAAGSLSLMGLFDWPECASAVVLLGENDWKPEARRAFERVEQHWRKQAKGRPLVVVNATRGSDLNDMVKA
jgi:hypothetical protein